MEDNQKMEPEQDQQVPQELTTGQKIMNIVRAVFTWALVILSIGIMIFTIVSTNFGKTGRDILGYQGFIVLTDSMSQVKDDPGHKGYFNAGDLVIVKKVDPKTLDRGDIIAFISQNSESDFGAPFGSTVTHMIRDITRTPDGELAFVTYGTTTNEDDDTLVPASFVLGAYQFRVPYAGTFLNFLKTTPGYIVCIFLPFLALILSQGINSIQLFRKYKAEQLAEVEAKRAEELAVLAAERERLEAERAESQRMLEELRAMQQQMQQQNPKDPE